jgi:2-keto-4-pentenoate hydratase/2-oxohepta-3-ene-1,7-dioic acid hydratase in catechol pathway
MCDFSARDVQIPEMRSGMGPQKAKHFLSSMATAVPGELFSIGALSAGSGMEIGRWLSHGDTLELDLPGVGHITHQIK